MPGPAVRQCAERVDGSAAAFHPVKVERAAKSTYQGGAAGGLRVECVELEAPVALARALS